MHSVASDHGLEKELALLQWLRRRGSVLIGFSGGVDSTYLAACAVDALGAERVLAVIGRSASLAESQWGGARAVAERIGVPVEELDTAELADPRYAANPSNRCYFCKTELWSRLVPVAVARGFAVVIDGTNASDLGGHRPGMAAAREHGVASPLADVGLTKEEIRARSRVRGLPTWSQPSAPCLASRIPYGTAVTPERLRDVDRAEDALRAIGIAGDLRVRHHGTLARVELLPDELARWVPAVPLRRLTTALLRSGAGFAQVGVDLRGFRSGGLLAIARTGRAAGNAPASAPNAASAASLQHALARRGVEVEVRLHGAVGVLGTADPGRFANATVRQAVLEEAAEVGLTSVAVASREAGE